MNIRKLLKLHQPDEFPESYVDWLLSDLVYLAGPYAHESKAVMEMRFNYYTALAGDLMKDGIEVYSPITHNHPIACAQEMPRTWDFWAKYDLRMLSRCKVMLVIMLDGWQSSTGVKAETEFAKKQGITIFHIQPLTT